jgi:hypothetical protein
VSLQRILDHRASIISPLLNCSSSVVVFLPSEESFLEEEKKQKETA